MVVEVDGLPTESLREHREVCVGVVVLLIVPEKEDAERAFFDGSGLFGF